MGKETGLVGPGETEKTSRYRGVESASQTFQMIFPIMIEFPTPELPDSLSHSGH